MEYDSYTLQYYHKIGRDVIKAGELVCNAVYLKPLNNFNQWYTPHGGKWRKTIFGLNNVTLTKVKVKSINTVNIPDISSNKLSGDLIRLCAVYVCDDIYDEILETIFKRITTWWWTYFES